MDPSWSLDVGDGVDTMILMVGGLCQHTSYRESLTDMLYVILKEQQWLSQRQLGASGRCIDLTMVSEGS